MSDTRHHHDVTPHLGRKSPKDFDAGLAARGIARRIGNTSQAAGFIRFVMPVRHYRFRYATVFVAGLAGRL